MESSTLTTLRLRDVIAAAAAAGSGPDGEAEEEAVTIREVASS